MKGKIILSVLVSFFALTACSDDDDKEFVLNREDIVGKNWYYNGWIGNKLGYSTNDVLEIIRFDNSGSLVGVELSGLRDTIAGTWEYLGSNALSIIDNDGDKKVWNVLGCEKGVLSLHDGWGARSYTEGASFLQDLSGDAYWVNQYQSDEGVWKTTLDFRIRGNNSIREAFAVLSDEPEGQIQLGQVHTYDGQLAFGKSIEFSGVCNRVRFSCRIGSKQYVKFDETLYDENIPEHTYNLKAEWQPTTISSRINVTWIPLAESNIYYQIEVLDKNLDSSKPFFISEILTGNGELNITEATQGKVENRLNSLVKGTVYKIRLSAILFEPNIGRYDNNADRNLQAVSYVTKAFVWGE